MMTTEPSDTPATVTVVIVNYFKAGRLLECVETLRGQSGKQKVAVAVVDNSIDAREHDLLAEQAGRGLFTLIEPGANIGYTKGCNLGVKALPQADFVVLCNPDIIWEQTDALEKMISIVQADPSIGILAPLQINDDGALVETARTFPTLLQQMKRRLQPASGSELFLVQDLKRDDVVAVDWLQSSCVVVRRSLWDKLGGLDQRYFLFMSDVELGRATWSSGARVCLTSSVRVRADGKRASSGGFRALLSSRTQRSHLLDAIRYYLANGFRMARRPTGVDVPPRP